MSVCPCTFLAPFPAMTVFRGWVFCLSKVWSGHTYGTLILPGAERLAPWLLDLNCEKNKALFCQGSLR